LDNYPIQVFDGSTPEDPKARLNLCHPNPKVLGLKIMTSDKELTYEFVKREDIDSIFSYAFSFIETFLIDNERRVMTPSFWKRSIMIITPDYPLSKFTLTTQEKENLINLGEQYVIEFFDHHKIQ
jgi:hypothetical protein